MYKCIIYEGRKIFSRVTLHRQKISDSPRVEILHMFLAFNVNMYIYTYICIKAKKKKIVSVPKKIG